MCGCCGFSEMCWSSAAGCPGVSLIPRKDLYPSRQSGNETIQLVQIHFITFCPSQCLDGDIFVLLPLFNPVTLFFLIQWFICKRMNYQIDGSCIFKQFGVLNLSATLPQFSFSVLCFCFRVRLFPGWAAFSESFWLINPGWFTSTPWRPSHALQRYGKNKINAITSNVMLCRSVNVN